MRTAVSTLEALRSLLGEAFVSERGGKVFVSPRTTAEVAAVTRLANENEVAVEIAGAGTKRGWSNPIVSDITLDMTRMVGVREHAWQDLTTTVAAGTTWSFLQHSLAAQSQRIALDPLWPDAATVGGIIATNDSGSLRSAYGSLRDLILGMTVVLADGTVARTGGKVVKNVAGYDLHKLMTGAFGTLGVVTEVTFRLHPSPKCSASWTMRSEDAASLDRCRHQIATSAIPFEGMQMRSCAEGFALDVCVVSRPECMGDLTTRLREIAAPFEVDTADLEAWSWRERSFVLGKATVKVTLSCTGIAALISDVRAMGGEGVVQQCGIMIATLPADPARLAGLRERAEAQGGSVTILSWPRDAASRPDIWGRTGNSLVLMREIKRRFDPLRTLNPGCFVGGL